MRLKLNNKFPDDKNITQVIVISIFYLLTNVDTYFINP